MTNKNLLNIFLVVVVASLAGIIYFAEEKTTSLELLSDADINSINTIKIKHGKHDTTITKGHDKAWRITQPASIDANNFRINTILKLINAPVHSKYALTEIDLQKAGLDKPETTIQFNDKTISFGIINPATDLRFIKSGNFIYTIEDVYFPLLNSHFGTLVSLSLLPAGSTVEKLILINQTISKNSDGLWKSNIGTSADNITKTIKHWQHNQAFGVHEYIERQQLAEVFVYLNSPQPISYLVTDTDPWLILARPEIGLEYHLDIEAYDQLITPQ